MHKHFFFFRLSRPHDPGGAFNENMSESSCSLSYRNISTKKYEILMEYFINISILIIIIFILPIKNKLVKYIDENERKIKKMKMKLSL